MNQNTEHVLNLLATISGIIAFVWIGLRADLKGLTDAGKQIRAEPRKWRSYWGFFATFFPYFLFIAATVYVIHQEFEITVKHHVIKTIQAGNRNVITNESIIEVASSDNHFQISISGAVYGPERSSIDRQFGRSHPVKVYAVVSEHSATQDKQNLAWVQGYEFGTLNPAGDYVVKAYLGGIGIDAAKDGDVFAVRIYIPRKQSLDFTNAAPYDNVDALPRPLFLSEPLYIRCRRPAN